jgi:hypothetical protein
MNFLYGFIIFFVGLITLVAFLPIFNEVVGLLPFSGLVVALCGVMVLLLVVGLIYRLYTDSVFGESTGGYVR